jgi:hypothetical protein
MAACPTSIPESSDQAALDAVAYTCTNRDGFNNDLVEKYGISGDWVIFGTYIARIHAGCKGATVGCGEVQNTFWTGFPLPGTYDVDNPKDTIQPILEKRADFLASMDYQALWAQEWLNEVDLSEIADAASLPVFMTADAVTGMDTIIETAHEIEEEERKEGILGFVSAILMLIPGVGGAIDQAVLIGLRRLLLLIGDIGNVALTIYDSISNPDGAAFAIFGLLLGGVRSWFILWQSFRQVSRNELCGAG